MTPELKKLHDLGFALHLLHPKSKAPIGSGWQKGPRLSWPALQRRYVRGMNVGVRLGEPSCIGGLFLAVIDCDVKGSEKKHFNEMREKLKKLFPHVVDSSVMYPHVKTGRGQGSTHIYVLTEKPVVPVRLAQSRDVVKLFMPSVKTHSAFEKTHLSEDERKQGVHLRPAWEISLMGTGQQVVMPPSIHPDTGAHYLWRHEPTGPESFPRLELTQHAERVVKAPLEDWAPVGVDLVCSALSEADYGLITSGEGCSGDRSASLFIAAQAMVKAGFSDAEILTVLTDRTKFLGQVAYDHTQSESRTRAAQWVKNFTLEKARREVGIEEAFKAQVQEVPLAEGDAEAQLAEIEAQVDWKTYLERTQAGVIRGTLINIKLIFENGVGKNVFRHNLFSGSNEYGLDAPWNNARVGAELRDIDITNAVFWLAEKWGFEAQPAKIHQAVAEIAHKNAYHPVRDFLNTLEWDGVPRINTWLKDHFEAQAPEPYLSAVSRKTLCAMVARVLHPGCKFDQVLILEGLQGVGKSTVARILAQPWFSDATLDINDKDSVLAMRSVWVMELAELSSMRRVDVESLKGFLSRQTDRVRLPYERLAANFARQCVFIGTTNPGDYLKDSTGNRRFWPVKVGQCDREGLERVRDQLLAEAMFAYELGEPLYLETKEQQEGAQAETEHRTFTDAWEDTIGEFLSKGDKRFNGAGFSISDLFSDFGPIPRAAGHTYDQMRAANVLRKLGYEKMRVRRRGNKKVLWVKDGGRGHT